MTNLPGAVEGHSTDRYKAPLNLVPPSPPERRLEKTADEVLSLIQEHAFEQALRELNAQVPHRFTAIFKIEDELVRNVIWIDKLHESRPDHFATLSLADTFCQFVMRGSFLHINDSTKEAMLNGSPYQGMIRAYHAVALTLLSSEVVGTLSHFDIAPQNLDQGHFSLLVLAARALPEYLLAADIWK